MTDETPEPVTDDETTAGDSAGSSADETAASTDSPQAESTTDASSSADDAPAAEVSASGGDAPSSGSAGEPEPALPPKERRARARAAKAAKVPARGPRTDEERQADRDALRAGKATARRAGREKARAKYKAEAHNRTATPPREHVAGTQKVRQGIVVSDKADKTITVRIDVARRHPKYEKIVRTSQKFHAHDEANDAHIGDTVTIREARPLSATKRWRLVEVLERAK